MDPNLVLLIGVAFGAGMMGCVSLCERVLDRGRATCSDLAAEAAALLDDIEPEGKAEILAHYRARESIENLLQVLAQGSEVDRKETEK